MIVLDSGVLIAYLNPVDAHHDDACRFLVNRADESFSVAAMTLAECLVHPVRLGKVHEALMSLMALELDVEDMPVRDAVSLARLRHDTNLKMPDAVVLHTAMAFDGSVVTTDARLARASGHVGVTAHLLG